MAYNVDVIRHYFKFAVWLFSGIGERKRARVRGAQDTAELYDHIPFRASGGRGRRGPLWAPNCSQTPLHFRLGFRRKFRWWPGSERYGGLTDRLLLAALIAPGAMWALLSFGWVPAFFVVAEALVVAEVIYRVASGTMLGD